MFLLGGHGQLFKLVTIHLHVGANNLVGDRGNRLVPVLLLRAVQQPLHYDWIRPRHVTFHKFLDCLWVKKEKGTLGSLVMHALARSEEPFQELRSKLIKFLLGYVSHKIKNFFYLPDKDYLFSWAGDRPEF